jgi:hypothetical protein
MPCLGGPLGPAARCSRKPSCRLTSFVDRALRPDNRLSVCGSLGNDYVRTRLIYRDMVNTSIGIKVQPHIAINAV